MITLALDSTAKIASVAVLDGTRVLGEYTIDNGLTQSELLLPMAEGLLGTLGLTFSDVGMYAVAVGPGSFTGVRIGVSLVKGLAFGKDIPCVAVSTLEALAENLSGLCGIALPCMDARRAQVYNAIFKSEEVGTHRLTPDRAISLSQLAEELREYEGTPIYISGDGYDIAYKALGECGIEIKKTPRGIIGASAVSVGRVAQRMYERGEYVSAAELSPTYLRLPQAERERLEKLQANN